MGAPGNYFDQFDTPAATSTPVPANLGGNYFDQFDAPKAPASEAEYIAGMKALLAAPKLDRAAIQAYATANHRTMTGTSNDALNWIDHHPGQGGKVDVRDFGPQPVAPQQPNAAPQQPQQQTMAVAPEGGFPTALRGWPEGYLPFADKLAAGLDTLIPTSGDTETIWSGGHSLTDAYQHNSAFETAQSQADAAANPWAYNGAAIGGAVLSPFAKVGEGIQGASMAARLGRTLLPGMTYGAVAGASNSDADTVGGVLGDASKGALIGGAGNVAGRAVGAVATGITRGVDNVAGKALNAAGIELTPGQAMGGAWKTAEDKLTSVPLLGDAIKQARARGVDSFNTERINSALGPIGDRLPEGTTGSDAIAYGQKAVTDAYDNARSGMIFGKDSAFNSDLQALRDRVNSGGADSLSPAYRKQFADVVKNTIDAKLNPAGLMSGDTYKTAVSAISRKAAKLSAGNNPADAQEYGQALRELAGLMDGAARRNPHTDADASALMDRADQTYRQWVLIQDAAQRPGGELGTFSPGQYDAAVKKGDSTVRHNAYSAGNAFGQPMSTNAVSVMGRAPPNSFTADRLMMAQLATGGLLGLGGHEAGLSPEHTAELAGLGIGGAALYSRAGNALASKALLGDRGLVGATVGKTLNRLTPAIGAAGGALALQHSIDH